MDKPSKRKPQQDLEEVEGRGKSNQLRENRGGGNGDPSKGRYGEEGVRTVNPFSGMMLSKAEKPNKSISKSGASKPKSKKAEEGSGLGNLAPPEPNKNAVFLNSLSLQDAQALLRCMCADGEVSYKVQTTADLGQFKALKSSLSTEPVRDGNWYMRLVTCKLSGLPSQFPSHPSWKFATVGFGSGSRAQRVKEALTPGAWETLKAAYPAHFSVQAHHIAYAADERRLTVEIPLNCGSGGSISHPCDEIGCLGHLEITPAHRDNMARQRCCGITLLIYNGSILQEVPCEHGQAAAKDLAKGSPEAVDVAIRSSCMKLRLLELDEHAASAVVAFRAS